ncbi:MAG: DnaJ domain-containing protein [Patescibacteria group bacterium]|nr:DnaJ domain-containing protein [Patescibacteria group bacterium]
MKDYYKTLGIDKTASKDDVKKAFRKLAHQYHPDKNKGNKDAEAKFKEASEAYSVLGDDNKRKQYDMFGSAGPGGAGFNQGAGGFNAGGFQGGFGGAGNFGGFDFSQFTRGGQGGFHFSQGGMEFDLGDIFGEFFGGSRGGARRVRKGRNITVDVELSFKDSIFGVEKEINVGGKRLAVTIPPGIESGQGLRVAGKGEPAPDDNDAKDSVPGDLIVRIWVAEHPNIRKEGFNLVMELDIKLTTALAGGTIDLDTLDGKIELKIPAGTSHGEILRLRGKGVPYETRGIFTGKAHDKRGDLLIVTHVAMPKKLSRKARELIDELGKEGL